MDAVNRAGPGGHKEINRTNLSMAEVQAGLAKDVVRKQLELLRFRNTFGAFGFDAELEIIPAERHQLKLKWAREGNAATLEADLAAGSWRIQARDFLGREIEMSN
jgi:sucrose phosphorylase